MDGQIICTLLSFNDVDLIKKSTHQQLDIVALKYAQPATVLKPDALHDRRKGETMSSHRPVIV